MRLAFFTDAHLSGKRPRRRIDDYTTAILSKMAEVYHTAHAESCDFVAFGGDFFNTHRIFSYEAIGDAMDILEAVGLSTFMCLGEHDLYAHSPKTYPKSTLAFLVRRCPAVNVITKPVEVSSGVVLYAKHEWESPDMIGGKGVEVDPAKYNILICHELITNESAPFDVIHTSTFENSPFDLVLSGDLHDGYSPHEVNGTWFCNPGSLARQRISDSHRHPQMAIVEFEKGIDPVIDIRKLECAQPGDEVFGESVMEIVNAAEEDGDGNEGEAFAEEILKFEANAVDIHDFIQKAGAAKGIRQPVLDYLATKGATEEAVQGENDGR